MTATASCPGDPDMCLRFGAAPDYSSSLRLRADGSHLCELALEQLGDTIAPACSYGRRGGIGEDFLLPVVDRVEDSQRDRFWGCLEYVGSPCHIGIHRAGQDRVNPYPLPGHKGAK